MKFSTEGVEAAVDAIAKAISESLSGDKKVLWLVSGGSCISPQVQIMHKLSVLPESQLTGLSVLLVDERYGAPGHANSNDEQLLQAGFDPGNAQWHKVNNGLSFAETVAAYSKTAADLFAGSDKVFATLGMGPDAHTAGLLPDSPAFEDTISTVIGYTWSDYERMTLGVEIILKIDLAYLLAYGESKKPALERLLHHNEPVEKLPAKLLYDLPDVTVYNDYIKTEE
jgi:6-phosphogluconolactonase/glucosamine-6-phosphate isomerase/deaminase